MNRTHSSSQGTHGNILEILETHLVLMDLSPELADTILRIAEVKETSFERVDRLVERALLSEKTLGKIVGPKDGAGNADKED